MVNKNTLKSFIETNMHVDQYVIFTHNQPDFEILRSILIELCFKPTISIDTLANMMKNCAEEHNYECGWRISKRRGIAWNGESIEWWKLRLYNIIEIHNDGSIQYHGDISRCPFGNMIPLVKDGNVIGCYFYNIDDIKE